jgi:DNA polymerase III subunit delta'
MLFREIIGQDILKNRLVQVIEENRLSHAWLLFGAEGTGALPLSVALARYILCTNRGGRDSCGICAGCSKISKYIHPDLHFVFPVNKTRSVDKDGVVSDDFMAEWRAFLLKNPYGRLTQWFDHIEIENKQGIINTEESRRLAGKLGLKPFEAEYKVAIIWHPEKMNEQASNKLLKLLEEPPHNTVFLLVSENPDQILSTVKSRCIPVKVPRISKNALTEALMNIHQLDQATADKIERLASGNYLKALDLISEVEDISYNFNKFRELMRNCFSRNIPGIMKQSEELAVLTREKQKSFLEYGLRVLRESLALHFNTGDIVYISDEEQDFTPKFAPYINGNNIVPLTEELNKAIQDVERNGNSRIIMLDLALKISTLIKN